jgi:hypothetical protein
MSAAQLGLFSTAFDLSGLLFEALLWYCDSSRVEVAFNLETNSRYGRHLPSRQCKQKTLYNIL